MRTSLSIQLLAVLLVASPVTAFASTERAFISACIHAFDQSSSNGSLGVGRRICECTAKESKHQGVSRSALARETAKIKADPKYQIKDTNLLNAFRYCSIENLRDS